jgi:hypothetical protein
MRYEHLDKPVIRDSTNIPSITSIAPDPPAATTVPITTSTSVDDTPQSVRIVLSSSNKRGDYQEYPTYNKPNSNEEKFSKNLREICLYMVINIAFGTIIIVTWFMNIDDYYQYFKKNIDKDKVNLNDINYYVEKTGGFFYNLNLVPLLIYFNIKDWFMKLLLYFNKNEKFDPVILIAITVIFIILITFIALSSMGINNI